MTPETEKRLAEIRERIPYGGVAATRWGGMYADDCLLLLSIIDELRAENDKLRNHPAIIAFPEPKKSIIY